MEPLVQMNEISKNFGGVKALQNVNLTINPGEIHCLAGENGSGKSTLIKVLSGVNKLDEGELFIEQKRFNKISTKESIQEGIQVIYQDFSVFSNLTVKENLALGYQITQKKKLVTWNTITKIAKQALKTINVNIDINEKVEKLSVADKQLIAIARSLLFDAKLIIMDEPTTALTSKEVEALFTVITKLKNEGISILFVSHKMEEIFEIADKVTVLRNGKNVVEKNVQELDTDKMIYYMTGREVKETTYKPKIDKSQPPLLKLERFGLKNMFKNINLAIFPGEIIGITGSLGSGRTEVAETIFGITTADQGEIIIEGKNTEIKNPRQAIQNNIAYVPEDRLIKGLFLDQSIKKNIVVSNIDNLLKKFKIIDDYQVKKEIKYWISNLDISAEFPDRAVQVLSGGNQQKVVLAKWLATKPKVLILNSPTVGVDIGSKNEIHSIIREQAQQKGLGVIIISDDIAELKQNCNRIIIMDKGKIDSVYGTDNLPVDS